MPSNHCSNWEYHEWLKKDFEERKNKFSHEATLFWCDINDGKELYYIGISKMNGVGNLEPYVTVQLTGLQHNHAEVDGRYLRKLITTVVKQSHKIGAIVDFRNEPGFAI